MESTEIMLLVVLLGSIHISYLYGKRVGIENTIDHLEAEGILEFDE
jgi:hypothetical protein